MRRARRLLALLVCVALLQLTVPALANGSAPPGEVSASGTTYDVDAYDAAGMGDSTPATARDVTSLIGDYGVERVESHTFHIVAGTTADHDWVKFTVTADDLLDKASFLFRTQSETYNLQTVIEIYHAGPLWGYQADAHLLTGTDGLAHVANDDDPWRKQAYDSAVVLRPTSTGTYYVRVRPKANGTVYTSDAGPYKLIMKRGVMGRFYGDTRVATAIAISKAMFQTPGGGPGTVNRAVVVANAYNYPDALAGSLLCGISDGPLLLTSPTSLSPGVGAEILRLGANRVYVVGGPAAVSDAVVTQLQALHPSVHVYRVKGDDRIHTACEIAMQAKSDAGGYFEGVSTVAVIAYAYNYPDALAASALACARNVPVLLTGTKTLAADTAEVMYHLGTTDVIIVGGTGVISSAVENTLKARFGSAHVRRIAGDTRYETAKEFASWACDLRGPGTLNNGWIGTSASYPALLRQLLPTDFGVASGETFADALPGGVACGQADFPILLNKKGSPYGYITAEHDGWLPPGDTDWVSDYHGLRAEPFGPCIIFGGPAAITQSTAAVLDNSVMLINAP
jgi:putative cell wall-binding protein